MSDDGVFPGNTAMSGALSTLHVLSSFHVVFSLRKSTWLQGGADLYESAKQSRTGSASLALTGPGV